MRSCALVAVFVTGCAFRPGGESGGEVDAADDVVDASGDDAAEVDLDAADLDAAGIDARPIDAPLPIDAGLILVESLMIPGDGTVVTSTRPLTLGVQYTFRVSGEVVIASNGAHGDAEYWNYDVGGAAEDLAGGTVDIGVGINDQPVDIMKSPNWGTYTATHVYSATITGLGSTVTANYHDGNPGNNSGNLVLEIYSP